jgi:hypothetical protein
LGFVELVRLMWRNRNKKRSRARRAAKFKPARRIPSMQNQHLLQDESSQKIKRALQDFANGNSIAGIADTGAAQNVVSLAFAQSLGLSILPCSHRFQLGSSRKIASLGEGYLCSSSRQHSSQGLLTSDRDSPGLIGVQWRFTKHNHHKLPCSQNLYLRPDFGQEISSRNTDANEVPSPN